MSSSPSTPTPENDPLTPEMRAEIASWIRTTANPSYTKQAQRFIDALVPPPPTPSLLDDVAAAIQPHISPVVAALAALAVVRDHIAAVELAGPADRTTERFDQGWNSAKRTIIALFDIVEGDAS